jgi:ribonuclease HI
MVYIMKIYVDGGCRRNGSSNAIGAASAFHKLRWGRSWYSTQRLGGYRNATNQRAEITAIILGLKMVLARYKKLDLNPYLRVTIHSDSKYAVNCMNDWIYKWSSNGWVNSRGEDVANQDLIREASSLDDDVKELGQVEYVWIPRSENEEADRYCNQEMDEMEAEMNTRRYYDDSSDSDW